MQRLSSVAVVAVMVGVSLGLVGCAPASNPGSPAPTATGGGETLGSVQDQLDSYWDYISASVEGAERPLVDQVRLVDPFEWAAVQATCMHDQGFPDVQVLPDGGIQPGVVDDGQQVAYLLARYVCIAQYPIDPRYTAPLSEDQIRVVYAYYTDELVPCLEEQGYSVTEAPSVETFIETFAGERWSPYADVFGADPTIPISEYYRVSEECPQWPEDLIR